MLVIENIKRVYPNNRGLHDFSLTVSPGEVVSFVGPNGSGKSTAINIIAGITLSESGYCKLDGIDTYKVACKQKIGYLEEDAFYYPYISIQDYLDFIRSLKYPNTDNAEIFRLLDVFKLSQLRHSSLGSLSMGLRKRVGIISAIMNSPPLIILDEPTNSIDAEGLLILKDELSELQKSGAHIILSGHELDFLKTVSSKFVFIGDGYYQVG